MRNARVVAATTFALLSLIPHVVLACPSDLDASFADGGVRVQGVGANNYVSGGMAVVVRPNGDIVVAGGYAKSPAVYRYHHDGSPDQSFGNGNGIWVLPGTGAFTGLVVDDEGRIVAAGWSGSDGTRPASFLIARFTDYGELDPDFGENGVTITSFGAETSAVRDLTILSDGRLVAVGESHAAQQSREIVACYRDDGHLDLGFGDAGISVIAPGAGSAMATSVIRVEDDAVVISGIRLVDGDTVVAKLDANGSPVDGFGTNGIRLTRSRKANEQAWSVATDASGRILVAGLSEPQSGRRSSVFVRRYLANGQRDRSYGRNGLTRARFSYLLGAQGMAVSADGHVSVPGWRILSGRRPPFVVRFDASGARDRAFGKRGVAYLPRPKGGTLWAATIQDDQRLVVTGEYGTQPILARFVGGEWDGQEQCVLGCGNSIITPPEQCDDGNALNGDGCSAACTTE